MSGGPGTRRQLGHAQMAFVRCWAEGLDLTAAWARYLDVDGPADPRRARRELQRLRDELGGLARVHGQPRVAALLRRDPDAMAEAHPSVPTLEAFRERQPPDFYADTELVALYEAEFGTALAGPARRRQRLRERLVLALHWLEGLAVREPLPTDPLSAWFDERVAARLAAAGLLRIDALMAHIGARGFHWHRGIGRVGPEGAARVVRWLRAHEPTLGALPRPALVPLSRLDIAVATPPPSAGIVPLERFAPPRELDGANGSNRAPLADCRVAAGNDLGAVQAWLALRVAGSHTWRAYRKEAERFLLWAVLERGKPLASLDAADCAAYRAFLAAPGAPWTGPRHARRWSTAWRPFEAALAPRSAATAVTIVRSMCSWLVAQHYLAANPWEAAVGRAAVRQARDAAPPAPLRALSQADWGAVQRWLATLPPCPATRRLRFMLDFGHATGLRLSELAAARFAWLQEAPQADGRTAWWIEVPGRGARCRRIPVPAPVMESFRDHLTDRGRTPQFPSSTPDAPLIARLDLDQPLSATQIYEVLASGFGRCAASLATQDPGAAKRLRRASTHWLRHSSGANAAADGLPAEGLRARLGHARRATVSVYLGIRPEVGPPA